MIKDIYKNCISECFFKQIFVSVMQMLEKASHCDVEATT